MKNLWVLNHGPTDFSRSLCAGPFATRALARQAMEASRVLDVANWSSWELIRVGNGPAVVDSSTVQAQKKAAACKAMYDRAIKAVKARALQKAIERGIA
jgi:hypothetical protein